MLKKYPVLIISFLLLSMNLHGQIEKEIKAFVDSTEFIVTNGRKLLLDKISNNDFVKAKEIYRYLTIKTLHNNSSAFYYDEDLYINMLVRDWQNLALLLLDYQKLSKKSPYSNTFQMIVPLRKKVSDMSDLLISDCQRSGLDDESVEIIEIILHLLKTGSADPEYNLKINAFNKLYKPSKYDDVLKFLIPKTRIRGSLAFSFGSGMIITTGKLAENFSPNASFNFTMDINIQKVFTSLYINSSSFKLKQPFSASNGTDAFNFQLNESFHYMDAGLKAGYFVTRNSKFNLAPFASVSSSLLESKRFDADEKRKEYKVINSFTYGFGLHSEFKILTSKTPAYYTYPVQSYLSLKAEAGYDFITSFKDNSFKGNTPYFTIGLVWGIGDF